MSSLSQAALFRLARTLALVEPSRPTRLIAILRKTHTAKSRRFSLGVPSMNRVEGGSETRN
jgi:hypothetical protein